MDNRRSMSLSDCLVERSPDHFVSQRVQERKRTEVHPILSAGRKSDLVVICRTNINISILAYRRDSDISYSEHACELEVRSTALDMTPEARWSGAINCHGRKHTWNDSLSQRK